MVIDSSRSGAARGGGAHCQSWCNLRSAGLGQVATVNTGVPDVIDAFFWIKTPGESDGCTELLPSGERCPRFDPGCAKHDSFGAKEGEPRAPEAGAWFEEQMLLLVQNGRPGLDQDGALDSYYGHVRPPHPPARSPPTPPPPPPPRESPPPPPPSPPLPLPPPLPWPAAPPSPTRFDTIGMGRVLVGRWAGADRRRCSLPWLLIDLGLPWRRRGAAPWLRQPETRSDPGAVATRRDRRARSSSPLRLLASPAPIRGRWRVKSPKPKPAKAKTPQTRPPRRAVAAERAARAARRPPQTQPTPTTSRE